MADYFEQTVVQQDIPDVDVTPWRAHRELHSLQADPLTRSDAARLIFKHTFQA
jgi:hypothetical protein